MLSVIIPAHNEKENLVELIERFEECLPHNSEIIFVNNGSTDNSEEILASFPGFSRHSVKIINLKLGEKTTAIKKGIEESTGNLIAMIDGDLQYNPEDINKLLTRMISEQADFVNGWRDFDNYPWSRRMFSYIYNWLYRKMFGTKVHDANCGLKLFTREVASQLRYRKGFHRYFVAMASDAGYSIIETKVPLNASDSKSSYGTKRVLDGFVDLISIKLSMTILKKPMEFFGISSAFLILCGVIYSLFNKTFFPSILIVSGFISFMFGLIAEMIINLDQRWRLNND